jgi:hypothetical protein
MRGSGGRREFDGRRADFGALRSGIVDAIGRLRRDQRAVESRLGTAFVDAASLQRALADQRRLLDAAREQIRQAHAAARRAAEGAAVDGGDVAAAPYRLAADGFVAQLRVVEATAAQLDRLGAGASDNLEQARRVLRESAASLDRALRAEVGLLSRVERLDRERLRGRGGHSDWQDGHQ